MKRFFGVSGPEYDRLFGLHDLEHKKSGDPERTFFDGLCCDGSANYLKLAKDGDDWNVLEFKARSYRKEAKAQLAPWIVETYSNDNYQGPPPLTESVSLLGHPDAAHGPHGPGPLGSRQGRQGGGSDQGVVPVGDGCRTVQSYKVINTSQFLFRTPEQRGLFERALEKFGDSCGCGLEAVSLRRGYAGRRRGSLANVAQEVYDYIQAGGVNPTKEFNLTRDFKELEHVRDTHLSEMTERKEQLKIQLYETIDARNLDARAALTGWFVGRADVAQIGQGLAPAN